MLNDRPLRGPTTGPPPHENQRAPIAAPETTCATQMDNSPRPPSGHRVREVLADISEIYATRLVRIIVEVHTWGEGVSAGDLEV